MNKSLKTVNWKVFYLSDIFTNYHGKRLVKEQRKNGNIPLLTASESNQGVSDYISKNKNMTKHIDFISIDMFGHAFYHDYNCYGDDNIYFFKNNSISKQAKLFIVVCINKNSSKYSYGNQFRQDNADKDKIILPVNSKGEPDYKFMEEYIKEREAKLKNQYKDYIKSNVNDFKEIKLNKEWKEFFISEIFEKIQKGKRLIKKHQREGNMPYVSSTALNNGVDNFIGNEIGVRKYENCLSLANSGSVGACFYEPYEFVASDHVTHLKGNYSKYAYLFMSCMLNRLSEKYNFNREINDVRIQREKMFLPVNSKNEPDYEFMHNYMLYLEQKKILEYLEYINE